VNDVVNLFNSQKSRASNYVGTHIYMSPEMIHSTISDEKGDLWAYGCILYEMFVGKYLHIEFDSS
jgi:3-phosphoinositide dependent protein kinase-1